MSREQLLIAPGETFEPVEFVGVDSASPELLLPEDLRDQIAIHTIHSGDVIPQKFVDGMPARAREEVRQAYVREKDWGATGVARLIASRLGLGGFHRVNIARVLLDYGRFPGNTSTETGHFDRWAINHPFSEYLDHELKRDLLENYYDVLSSYFERIVRRSRILIAIHSYDKYNPAAGTPRPEASILFRPNNYQREGRMSSGVFDPIYPQMLGEFTADRKLAARISLELETHGISVSHNHPYLLPDGSVEIRSQVWYFFNHLLERFRAHEHYGTKIRRSDRYARAFEDIRGMLLDANRRYPHTETLRGYIHRFRRAPEGESEAFEMRRQVYQDIAELLSLDASGQPTQREEDWELVRRYRMSPARFSSLAIEIRKDQVWRFADGEPIEGSGGLIEEGANRLANLLARAVHLYCTVDRPRYLEHLAGSERLAAS